MGKWVDLGAPNPVGYCLYHHATLSVRQLQRKECLKKGCKCLSKREAHPFWEEQAKRREQRRERKARLEEQYRQITGGAEEADA